MLENMAKYINKDLNIGDTGITLKDVATKVFNNFVTGEAKETGETLNGIPIKKLYIEGTVPAQGESTIIVYNCKQVLECNLFAKYNGSFFRYDDIGYSQEYNEVRIYNSSAPQHSGNSFKGFITYIEP